MTFSRSSYTPMLMQSTEILLFPHSPFHCRPWTHILLPPVLSRLALFPNINATFAVRECCNWISICLKEIRQVISILHGLYLPCASGRAKGWRSSSFSASPHRIFLLSLLLQQALYSIHCSDLSSYSVFDGPFPFCVWQAYPSLFSFCSFPSFLPFLRPLRIVLAEHLYEKIRGT